MFLQLILIEPPMLLFEFTAAIIKSPFIIIKIIDNAIIEKHRYHDLLNRLRRDRDAAAVDNN